MRQKIGTALHSHLVVRLKELAAEEGRAMNEIIEDALEAYLLLRERDARVDLVRRTAGKYKVTDEQFRAVMEEDMYDV